MNSLELSSHLNDTEKPFIHENAGGRAWSSRPVLPFFHVKRSQFAIKAVDAYFLR